MRIRHRVAVAATGAALMVLVAGCSQGTDEATAEYCNNLDALRAEAAQLQDLVAGDATVSEIAAQAQAVSSAYRDVRDAGQDVGQAISEEVDDAYAAYQDQVDQIPADATLSEAVPLYGDALEAYLDQLAEITNDVGCEDA